MITQEYLKQCLTYNPETGQFTRLERPRQFFKTEGSWKTWNARYAAKPAGFKHTKKSERTSYIRIGIDGKTYQAHRLAWLYIYGTWPKNQIDHIDGDGANNKLENLRDVTNRENGINRKTQINNTSGVTGVSWHKAANKFRAQIKINGKNKHLGYYTTLEAAIAARAAANERYGYTTPEAQ